MEASLKIGIRFEVKEGSGRRRRNIRLFFEDRLPGPEAEIGFHHYVLKEDRSKRTAAESCRSKFRFKTVNGVRGVTLTPPKKDVVSGSHP